jgi:Mn-dependent DtxR family transcriptional regulator
VKLKESIIELAKHVPFAVNILPILKEIEKLESHSTTDAVVKIKELIEYGEQQWDGQPINKGMLEGLIESVRILEEKQ